MKNFWGKIWIPALLVLVAAAQSSGIDAGRAAGLARLADSLILNRLDDSSDIILQDSSAAVLPDSTAVADTLAAIDSLAPEDSIEVEQLFLSARDTIKIPDSLKDTDPFFYKYYIAVKDSATRVQVRDSLILAGDTTELFKLDSLYIKDSTEVAKAKFDAWYASLTRRERKKYDAEQALPGLIAAANRKLEIKDSIKAYKDSVLQATPRILETFAVPDSMHYKRLIMWKHDRYFQNIALEKQDTTYNYHFNDNPLFKEDLNATWLGVSGSPVQLYDFFKRREAENMIFYTPYEIYSFTPETLPQYNTKTPYTELAYWGTLFANQEKEESCVRVLTTQNITPALNLTLEYEQYGGNGMLKREDTDNRTALISTNYLGKKYMMHAGYIYNKVERSENGGIIDYKMIRDTTVDAREIDVHLRDASNLLKKNTIYLDQTLRIPFTFLDKDVRMQKKAEKLKAARRDSIMASGDSIAIAALQAEEAAAKSLAAETPDTAGINTDITTAFIGHSSEYSVVRKTYEDVISDDAGRDFYHDRFYLNPTTSHDSLRVMKLENRVFIRLQPWKSDGIVSKLDVGLGDKLLSHYSFRPTDYLEGSTNVVQNSLYLYAGANGQYRKYFKWDAFGRYTFAGSEVNDFNINANMSFSAYPFRRDRNSPLTLKAHFETSLREPDYYEQFLCTNHFKWDNSFGKISTTKLEGSLSIPKWKLEAKVGYALLSNNIYYDTLGIVRQNTKPMSVLTASLRKDFTLWKFHLDHQALLQFSSNQDVLPLPTLALNFRYYFQFDVVKNVMQMQVGANGTFTTKWYAQSYNPVLGVFYNQKDEKFGNSPLIDVFVNIQWKRASIFVKVVNMNMGWPTRHADYFTANGYIASQRALKFGISWPFYVLPGRSGTSAAAAGATGSGRGGAGMSAGRSGSGRSGAVNRR
ncbi:MAG: putative porin [Bacteroidales bacterium]|nr:putative porin [Bacteroidales bacterium]